MKSIAEVEAAIERRLARGWHTEVTGASALFPHAFPLGRVATDAVRGDYVALHELTLQWQEWARARGVEVRYENRAGAGGTRQIVPTHVVIADVDAAAAAVGEGWPERLARARQRADLVAVGFPDADAATVVRLVDGYEDVDVEVLLAVARWYLADPARATAGVTPRQVPLPGVHAKWLQTHTAAVRLLTGLDDLGLLPAHPSRVHLTYLDPAHRAAGGRWHDSASVGDRFVPAYVPRVVVISENKDTAVHFPELEGAITVEGGGAGGRTAAAFSWIREAPVVIYWGDMDAAGYAILDGYRRDFGRDMESVFMDLPAYEAYRRFGTDVDARGRALPGGGRRLEHLRDAERQVYDLITAPGYPGPRRVEQERIPLTVAHARVSELIAQAGADVGGRNV